MAELGAKSKNRGLLRRHPALCCSLLVVTMLSALVSSGLLLGFRKEEGKKVDSVDALTGEHVNLSPNSTATNQLYTRYYFFNVTNPAAVAKGQRPNLTQLGPFVFRKNRTKFDRKWTEDENVVTFSLDVNYTLDRQLSWADPKDIRVTTINIPLIAVSAAIIAMENNPNTTEWQRVLLKELLKIIDKFKEMFGCEGLFVSRTVDELLWGYEDPLLKDLNKLAPSIVSTTTFGYNNKSELQTPNTVFTGKNDSTLVGQYIQWNGHHEIAGWGSRTARMINGTGGYVFHPKVSRKENLTAFISDLYRSVYFSYQRDVTLHGIKLYEFSLPAEELLNTTQDHGFYPNGPSGVLNLTAVTPDYIALFGSKPHFLDADHAYLANVSGLHPTRALHDTFLHVEPISGAVLSANKRFQLNLHLHSYKDLPELKNISPDLMLPIFWASEDTNITTSLANDFKRLRVR